MKAIRFFSLACLIWGSVAAAATYTVKPGDTLYSIAKANHIDPVALMQLNKLPSSTIQVGQSLSVGGDAGKTQASKAPAPASTAKAGASSDVAAPAPQASREGQDAVVRAAAFRFLNIRYRLGGVGQGGIDCSGYTHAVFQQLGVNLPRTARAQYGVGTPVSRAGLRLGDLMFFNTLGRGVSHVGIYIGNGQFTNANSYYGHTMVDKLSNPYWSNRFVGARRVLPGG